MQMSHMMGNAILFHYFWGSGLYPHLTSSSWKTLLAFVFCLRSSPWRCPHSSRQWGPFKSSSSVAFTLHLGHRDTWQVCAVLCLELSGFPPRICHHHGAAWDPQTTILSRNFSYPLASSQSTPPWGHIVLSPQKLNLRKTKARRR